MIPHVNLDPKFYAFRLHCVRSRYALLCPCQLVITGCRYTRYSTSSSFCQTLTTLGQSGLLPMVCEPHHCTHKTEKHVFVNIVVIPCWSGPRNLIIWASMCKMQASPHNTCPSDLATAQHRYDRYSMCSPVCSDCTIATHLTP